MIFIFTSYRNYISLRSHFEKLRGTNLTSQRSWRSWGGGSQWHTQQLRPFMTGKTGSLCAAQHECVVYSHPFTVVLTDASDASADADTLATPTRTSETSTTGAERPVSNFATASILYFTLQQNYRLFYKHACAGRSMQPRRLSIASPGGAACTVGGPRACHRRQMFFSAAASQKWGGGRGRTTQRDELFMASLHDTTASQGRDGEMQGTEG